MNDVITMAQKAATSDPSGLTLVATDANGTIYRLKPEGVANMLAETGLVLVRHSLVKQDLDANDFTSPGIWIPASDLNRWTDVAFENFPVATTKEVNGGFTLIVMKEGGYLKQFFTKYEDNTIYLRSAGYKPAANPWTEWRKLTSTAVRGG